MNCSSLALVLIKKISDSTSKKLKKILKAKKKAKQSTDEPGSDTDNEDRSVIINNAKDQINALLAFKEALCSERCNEAIINAFKHYWLIEQDLIEQGLYLKEDKRITKLSVAICLSYFKRILSIAPHPEWSSANEIISHKSIHNKYIVQLRVILSLIPGIVSDLGMKDKSRYHDDWLTDIILILYNIVQSFDPQDLFTVWKSKSLMENFENLLPSTTEEEEVNEGVTNQSNKPVKATAPTTEVVVPKSLAQATKQQVMNSKGSLSESLSLERNARMNQQLMACNRFSKFTATYRLPVKPATSLEPVDNINLTNIKSSVTSVPQANSGQKSSGVTNGGTNQLSAPENNPGKVINSSAILLKNPFQNSSESIPQAKTKRNKKNITYTKENPAIDTSVAQSKITHESQQACVVVASLVDRLTDEACLKSFIRRVNEDLRRDEMRISPEMELNYFLIVAKLLKYNRLKLEDQYQQYLEEKKKDVTLLWEPDLRNIMDILDKMSFTRVTVALDRSMKNEALYDTAWIPLTLYYEMISYLRILLTSDIEGHHEIAVGALFRLFYTTTEKLDPLFKLFGGWKPGSYPKQHLHLLIQLSQETMLTLEAARNLFVNQGITTEEAFQLSQAKKRKLQQQRQKDKKTVKQEMDMEQYLLASLRFNIDEYFKRFVNYHNLDIYFRILTEIDKNPSHIHQYISAFFERLIQFQLENPYETTNNNNPSEDGSNPFTSLQAVFPRNEPVNLTYMLYNLRYLIVIEKVLNHPQLPQLMKYDAWIGKIITVLRKVVKRFGELCQKNHLLYLEILFLHPRAHEHTIQLETVYESMQYTRREIMSGFVFEEEKEVRGKEERAPWDKEDDDNDSADTSSSSDSDLGDELDVDALPMNVRKEAKERRQREKEERRRTKKEKKLKPQRAKSSHQPWTEEEDAKLMKYFKIYAGSANVFVNIERAFNKTRREDHIEARVKELQLHLKIHNDSDDEDDEQEDNNDLIEDQGSADNVLMDVEGDRDVALPSTPATQPQLWKPFDSSDANTSSAEKSADSALNTTSESLFASSNKKKRARQSEEVFWEVNEDDLKRLDERALGLFSDEDNDNDNAAGRTTTTKKRSLKKVKDRSGKKQKTMSSMISDEEDNFFNDETVDNSLTVNEVTPMIATVNKRSLLDSDEE